QEHPNLVTEGRDQGSVVFPQADLKFYLDASPHERAHRRVQQLRDRGEHPDPVQILADIMARDQRDRERKMGPLIRPENAIEIDTTTLTQEQVIQTILNHAVKRK